MSKPETMSRILTSNAVGFDRLHVHPWNAIETNLIQELSADPVTLQEMCEATTWALGRGDAPVTQTAEELITFLRNNLGSEESTVDFLINLTSVLEFHTEMGTNRYADLLTQHKESLTKYKEKQARDQIYEDKNFVGRIEEMKLIETTLTDESGKVRGVCICGLGGLGKTSLAREVCFRITQRKEHWNIYQIDLREKNSLRDLIRDTLVGLDQMCSSDDEDQLKSQLIDFMKKNTTQRTILLYDNVDDLMSTRRGKEDLLKFLEHFLSETIYHKIPIRLLLTTREKLVHEDGFLSTITRVLKGERTAGLREEMVMEVELQPLRESEAVQLFTACITSPERQCPEERLCVKIVKNCGYSPLAIRSVAATIQSGRISPEQMQEDLKCGRGIPSLWEVSKCLDNTYQTLDNNMQSMLLKLSVFHTAKFDLEAAAYVISEGGISKAEHILELNFLYIKGRHLIEIDDMYLKGRQHHGKLFFKEMKYSLHPLVYEFLRYKTREDVECGRFVQEAEIRFVEFFERRISSLMDNYDRNCMATQHFFRDNRVHAKNFYNTLLKIDYGIWKIQDGIERLLTVKRMHELADLIIKDSLKFELLDKWLQDAEKRGNRIEHAYWKVFKALKYFDIDDNEMASRILDEVWNGSLAKMKHDCEEIKPVLGNFYYMRGRICKSDGKNKEALGYFQKSMEYYRVVRKKFRLELANALNATGCAYYRLKQLESSRDFHTRAVRHVLKVAENFNNIDLPCYVNNIGTCHFKIGKRFERAGNFREAQAQYEHALRFYECALKLDTQFDMDKFDSFAQKLRCRADVYSSLGRCTKAEDDIERALNIHMANLPRHHVNITVAQHKLGKIKRYSGIKLYADGKKLEAFRKLSEAAAEYDKTNIIMKLGGLPQHHPKYGSIKKNHLWILKQINDVKRMQTVVLFYMDFDAGQYNERRANRMSSSYMGDHLQSIPSMVLEGLFGRIALDRNNIAQQSRFSSGSGGSQQQNESKVPCNGSTATVDRSIKTKQTVKQQILKLPHLFGQLFQKKGFAWRFGGTGAALTGEIKAYIEDVLKDEKTVLNFSAILREEGLEVNAELKGDEDHIQARVSTLDGSSATLSDLTIGDLLNMTKDDAEMEEDESDDDDHGDDDNNMRQSKTSSRRAPTALNTEEIPNQPKTSSSKAPTRIKKHRQCGSRDLGTQMFLEDLQSTVKEEGRRLRSKRTMSKGMQTEDSESEKKRRPMERK